MTDDSGMMSEEEFLAHHGVKGMKWGERKAEEKSSGSRSSAKPAAPKPPQTAEEKMAAYLSANPPKLTKAQKQQHLDANQAKHDAKFGGDPNPKDGNPAADGTAKGWRPTKKQVAVGIIGAVAVGAIIYGGYKYGKYIHPPAGSAVGAGQYKLMTANSKLNSWTGSGYIKPSSFNQKEFTLPAGHTFHRISTVAESGAIGNHLGGGGGNYATHSIDDFNRYVTAFRGEKGPGATFHHVTFKSTEEIKVPDLMTRLDTMREMMSASYNKAVTPAEAKAAYEDLSGGSWSTEMSKRYLGELAKKGYGAIVDDMDAGVIGESPLFVFAKESLTHKTSVPFTDADISHAESLLTEITNRK
jgi:hypothetical protein